MKKISFFAGFVSREKGQQVSGTSYPDTDFPDWFYDAGLCFFRIRFWGETKFLFRGGHIFEKTFSEKFLQVGEYRYRSIVSCDSFTETYSTLLPDTAFHCQV